MLETTKPCRFCKKEIEVHEGSTCEACDSEICINCWEYDDSPGSMLYMCDDCFIKYQENKELMHGVIINNRKSKRRDALMDELPIEKSKKEAVKIELEDLKFILEVLKGNAQEVGKAISIINRCFDINLLETLKTIKKRETMRGYRIHHDEFDKAIKELGGMDKLIENTLGKFKDKEIKND